MATDVELSHIPETDLLRAGDENAAVKFGTGYALVVTPTSHPSPQTATLTHTWYIVDVS